MRFTEPPAQWARAKYGTGYDDYLARNDVPYLPDQINDFPGFYLERKRQLSRRLASVLGVDPDECAALVAPDEDESIGDDENDE